MNHISIVFVCLLLTGADFSCNGFIMYPHLTLTSFKAMDVTLKYTLFLKMDILNLHQEKIILIVSKFQYTQCMGSRPVKLKPILGASYLSGIPFFRF